MTYRQIKFDGDELSAKQISEGVRQILRGPDGPALVAMLNRAHDDWVKMTRSTSDVDLERAAGAIEALGNILDFIRLGFERPVKRPQQTPAEERQP